MNAIELADKLDDVVGHLFDAGQPEMCAVVMEVIAHLRAQYEALEPFANAKITYLDAPDGREVKAKHVHGLVYGDFRRARAALGGQSNEA